MSCSLEVCINQVSGLLGFLNVNISQIFEYGELCVTRDISILETVRLGVAKKRSGITDLALAHFLTLLQSVGHAFPCR